MRFSLTVTNSIFMPIITLMRHFSKELFTFHILTSKIISVSQTVFGGWQTTMEQNRGSSSPLWAHYDSLSMASVRTHVLGADSGSMRVASIRRPLCCFVIVQHMVRFATAFLLLEVGEHYGNSCRNKRRSIRAGLFGQSLLTVV